MSTSTANTPDLDALITSLSLEEKVLLLSGKDFWQTADIAAKGIPSVKVSDGPNGARGGTFVDGCKAACFPASVSLASTWDATLARRVGNALAEEALTKGARVLLGPTVCPHRHPLGGRNFESFSEDPLLAGELAAEYVLGLQEKNVGATVKHFAANEQETCRFTTNATISERALREIYLKPFEIAVKKANPWAIMTSYNLVNGTHADSNEFLLKKVLRGNWGWKGLVMSDWGGTNSTSDSLTAGLDLEMPGPTRWRALEQVKEALSSGETTEDAINARCRNVLELLVKTGSFADPKIPDEQAIDNPEHRALIREVGRSGVVLLKNEGSLLPLKKEMLKGKTVLMAGLAKEALIHGGGSASVNSHYRVSPWDALSMAFGKDIKLQYAKGAQSFRNLPPMEADFTLERVSTGKTDSIPVKKSIWAPMDSEEKFSEVTLTGTYTPKESGSHYLSCGGLGPTQFFIDDKLLYDQKGNNKDFMGFLLGGGDQETFQHKFEAGKPCEIRVKTLKPTASDGGLSLLKDIIGLNLGFMPESQHDEDVLAEAVDLARKADLVIVCTGHTPDWETEGQDQKSFHLPVSGSQDALVAGIAAVNKNVVVVNSTGVAVAMPWLADVSALVQAWFPGQEAGNAIADVLLGNVNPCGRLPVSFPAGIEDAPAHGNFPGEVVRGRPEVEYAEGVFIGYRHYDRAGVSGKLLFPFGFGLSYTTYSMGNLSVDKLDAAVVRVSVDVTNSGAMAGAQVVQAYAGPSFKSEVDVPVKQLVGFAKVHLEPGETKRVRMDVETKKLAYFGEDKGEWVVQRGEYRFSVGSSVVDIVAEGAVTVEEGFSFAP